MLFSVNFFLFLLGWILTSVYCYKAQLNLLFSFSMLEGKVFSLKFATKSIDEAHKTIRSLDPKSKFLFSKLEQPINEDEDKKMWEKLKIPPPYFTNVLHKYGNGCRNSGWFIIQFCDKLFSEKC